MKTKLISANYDKNTGISIVKIQNKYGVFTGFSKLHKEDKKYESNFAGCACAEMKAKISYMKKRIEILKYQIKALEDFYKNISDSKHFKSDSYEARKIRRRIWELKEEKRKWINNKRSCQDSLLNMIEERDKVVKKLYKRSN